SVLAKFLSGSLNAAPSRDNLEKGRKIWLRPGRTRRFLVPFLAVWLDAAPSWEKFVHPGSARRCPGNFSCVLGSARVVSLGAPASSRPAGQSPLQSSNSRAMLQPWIIFGEPC